MKRTVLLLAAVLFCSAAPAGAQSITVISPNGGERWTIGSPQTITWRATGVTGGFNIALFRGDTWVGRLVLNLPPLTTSYRWESVGRLEDGTIVPPGTDYRVSVRCASDTTISDKSDGTLALVVSFAVVAPVARVVSGPTRVRVTQPNDRRLYRIGGTETEIRWESENARPDQRLRVFLVRYTTGCRVEAGAEVIPLGDMPLSAGRMIWEILEPLRPCDNCAIRLTPQMPGDFASDESDECFALRGITTVRILTPNGGERFRRGSPIGVTYEVVNQQSSQRMFLALTYGGSQCGETRRRVAELPLTSSSFTWPGDATLPAGSYGFYLHVVTGHVTMEAEDKTDGCFTLY